MAAHGRPSRRARDKTLKYEGIFRIAGQTVLITPDLYSSPEQAAHKAIAEFCASMRDLNEEFERFNHPEGGPNGQKASL